jgi:hypothetical protein
MKLMIISIILGIILISCNNRSIEDTHNQKHSRYSSQDNLFPILPIDSVFIDDFAYTIKFTIDITNNKSSNPDRFYYISYTFGPLDITRSQNMDDYVVEQYFDCTDNYYTYIRWNWIEQERKCLFIKWINKNYFAKKKEFLILNKDTIYYVPNQDWLSCKIGGWTDEVVTNIPNYLFRRYFPTFKGKFVYRDVKEIIYQNKYNALSEDYCKNFIFKYY